MFSVLGGIFGVLVLIVAAPALAEVALKFSSFEYFWLVMLGFTCAIFIAGSDPLKGLVSLLLGLLISVVGLENPAGAPRYTFGNRRPDRRHPADPADDRHVRGVGGPALRGGRWPSR